MGVVRAVDGVLAEKVVYGGWYGVLEGTVQTVQMGEVALESSCVAAVTAALRRGEVGGVEFSPLLRMAACRLRALSLLSGVPRDFRWEAYRTLVRKFEKVSGLGFFCQQVSQMLLVNHLYGLVGMPRAVSVIDFSDARFEAVTIPSSSLTVLSSRSGLSTDGKNIPMGFVVPEAVYRGFLGLGVVFEGNTLKVSCVRRVDGVREILSVYDPVRAVRMEDLPAGTYALPGGFGKFVTKVCLVEHLREIRLLPRLQASKGYCYLSVVPPELRVAVAGVLLEDPTVGRLRRVCPGVATWSDVEATLSERSDGLSGQKFWHVDSPGFLGESYSDEDIIGASRGSLEARPDLAKLTKTKFMEFLGSGMQRPFSVMPELMPGSLATLGGVGDCVVGAGGSGSGGGRKVERELPLPALPTGNGGFPGAFEERSEAARTYVIEGRPDRIVSGKGHLRAVSAPVETVQWLPVADPAVREWSGRLAGGAPVGDTALGRMVRNSLAELQPPGFVEGRGVVLPSVSVAPGCVGLAWKPVVSPLPGWKFEKADLRRKTWYCSVPMRAGIWTRHELSVRGQVEINGFQVEGFRSVVWVKGQAVIRVDEKGGTVWRMVSDTGVLVLGAEFTSADFTVPTVRSYQMNPAYDKAVCLSLVSESPGAMTRYEVRVASPPGNTTVSLCFAGAEPAGCVRLAVRATALQGVVLHGVTVKAVNGLAEVVCLPGQLCVTYSLSDSRSGTVVLFEVSCLSPEAFIRGDKQLISPVLEQQCMPRKGNYRRLH